MFVLWFFLGATFLWHSFLAQWRPPAFLRPGAKPAADTNLLDPALRSDPGWPLASAGCFRAWPGPRLGSVVFADRPGCKAAFARGRPGSDSGLWIWRASSRDWPSILCGASPELFRGFCAGRPLWLSLDGGGAILVVPRCFGPECRVGVSAQGSLLDDDDNTFCWLPAWLLARGPRSVPCGEPEGSRGFYDPTSPLQPQSPQSQ